MYSVMSLADDGWIPLSADSTKNADTETISDFIANVIHGDIVPIVSICASFFCLYKALTGLFSSYSSYQRDKDSGAFKESLITSFIFLGLSAGLIYYIMSNMVGA